MAISINPKITSSFYCFAPLNQSPRIESLQLTDALFAELPRVRLDCILRYALKNRWKPEGLREVEEEPEDEVDDELDEMQFRALNTTLEYGLGEESFVSQRAYSLKSC